MIYRFDQFELDETEFQLTSPGGVLSLEPKALRVLLYLVKNSNRLVRKQEVLDSVWSEAFVSESTLTRTISLLRKALADDQREPRFIETVPTQGYRFKFPVEVIDFPLQANGKILSGTPEATESAAEIGATNQIAARSSTLAIPVQTRLRDRKGWLVVASAALLIGLIAGSGFWMHRHFARTAEATSQTSLIQASPVRSIAVLPFIPRGIPDKAYLGDSIAEEVATSLAQYSKLRVVSYTSSRNLSKSQAGIPQIALMLKVNDVLEGSVVGEGDQVAINLRLIDASNDSQLWSAQIERSPDNLLGLQDQISRQIVEALRLPLSQRDQQRMGAMQTASPEAYDSYLRARYFYNHPSDSDTEETREFDQAISLLKRATTLDPRYSAAYAMMGRFYERQIWLDKGDIPTYRERAAILADEALRLDPYSADAYYVRAETNFAKDNGFQWEAAAQDLKSAISIDPYHSGTHVFLGILYMRAGLLDKAESENRIACGSDPATDIDCYRQLGLSFELQSRYKASLDVWKELQPRYDDHAALMLWYMGKKEEAWSTLQTFLHKWPERQKDYDSTSIAAMMFASRGENAQAEAAIRQTVRNRLRPNASYFVYAQYRIGAAYALLGEKQKALAALSEAANSGLPCYPLYAQDPALNSLRGNPQFEAFLAGLRSQWQGRFAKL
jgi:DNA-binding winged helix-turn-helix (wHTH) protein/TolB-like protein